MTSIVNKIYQSLCDHKKLALVTIDCNSETVTCTAIIRKIICSKCGKIIVPSYLFDDMYELLMDKKLQEAAHE